MLNSSDTLYVLPSSTGSNAMWLASASDHHYSDLMIVSGGSIQGRNSSYNNSYGFRPLVCLNSNISLKWNEQDHIYEIK